MISVCTARLHTGFSPQSRRRAFKEQHCFMKCGKLGHFLWMWCSQASAPNCGGRQWQTNKRHHAGNSETLSCKSHIVLDHARKGAPCACHTGRSEFFRLRFTSGVSFLYDAPRLRPAETTRRGASKLFWKTGRWVRPEGRERREGCLEELDCCMWCLIAAGGLLFTGPC